MGDLSNYDFSSYGDAPTYELIPPGKYALRVDATEMGETRAGKLQLKVRFVITHGEHAGREVFEDFYPLSEKSMPFFWLLAQAGGHPNPRAIKDSSEIVGMQVFGKIRIEEGTNGYQDKNRVGWFEPMTGPLQETAPPAAQPAKAMDALPF